MREVAVWKEINQSGKVMSTQHYKHTNATNSYK